MNKIAIVAIVGVAFLAGGIISNADLVAEATNGNGNGAWAKMIARVTGLENQLNGISIRTVILHDDDAGHAAGWDPSDASNTSFLITDEDIKRESIVYAFVPQANVVCGIFIDRPEVGVGEGEMLLACPGELQEGQNLNYMVINNPSN